MGKSILLRSTIGMLIIVAFSVVIVGCSAPPKENGSIKKEREDAYQSELEQYSRILKPGMIRKDVENYLQSRETYFRKMCCIDERDAFADLVKVGKEPPPWYCGGYNVYIAFQFKATEPRRPLVNEADSDVLTKITIYYWLENCL